MSTITKFYLDKAKYYLADVDGNQVFMIIDYKDGKFKVVDVRLVNKANMKLLKNQVQEIASDLIQKKHDVNFSVKIKT